MANALSKEADESDDVTLAQTSNLLMLVSGVMTEKEDKSHQTGMKANPYHTQAHCE